MAGNNEDYLDSLLNSISKVKEDIDKEEEQTVKRASSISASPKVGSDDDFLLASGIVDPFASDPFEGIVSNKRKEYSDLDFLKEFEKELLSGEADRFIRDFETELDEEEAEEASPLPEDSLMDSIEGIVSAAKKQANTQMAEDLSVASKEAEEEVLEEAVSLDDNIISFGDDLSDDSAGDESKETLSDLDTDSLEDDGEISLDEGGLSFGDDILLEDEENESIEEGNLLGEDGDIDLDAFAMNDEDLADINDMMNADALGEAIDGVGDELDENTRRSIEGDDTASIEAKPQKGIKGFLNKIKMIIFGPDDEDNEVNVVLEGTDLSGIDLSGLSDEQLEIMKNLSGDTPAGDDTPEKGKKKKKEKKEKPPKEKKEKQPKPPKVKKEKKEKPPKEKDNTPPLPKAMVIIPALLLGSVLALVIGGTNVLSRGFAVSNAKQALESGNYIEAFDSLAGIEIKNEEDEALWTTAQILGTVQYKIDNYHIFMEQQMYDKALDSLICALGRAKANEANAEYYGVYANLAGCEHEIIDSLLTQFNVSEKEALEVYALRRRTEYTHRIYDFLERAGVPY